MNEKSTHIISQVVPDSPAGRVGIKAGDILVSVNGYELEDIFDYYYLADDEVLDIVVRRPLDAESRSFFTGQKIHKKKSSDNSCNENNSEQNTENHGNQSDFSEDNLKDSEDQINFSEDNLIDSENESFFSEDNLKASENRTDFSDENQKTHGQVLSHGEILEFHIEKDEDEDTGIRFENGLLDDYRSCSNKCIFCFVDQMPPGMRDTLYFKDDDTRLSFLQGNYVTLTNMNEDAIERIIDYRLAPINVSVHTTNPDLRCRMLHNRFAGDILKKIQMIADADLTMNSQIVLCKGINDGKELERTISDLLTFYPQMQSLSVVPVGMTKFRQGLYPLEPFTKEDARDVIRIITKWQDIAYEKYGAHFVQASDEWYLLAEEELPPEERYDGYIQLENGVGMLRLLKTEFDQAIVDLNRQKEDYKSEVHRGQEQENRLEGNKVQNSETIIATGTLAAPFIQKLVDEFHEVFPQKKVRVVPIINHFFGESITVSGLITGQDLIEQLGELVVSEADEGNGESRSNKNDSKNNKKNDIKNNKKNDIKNDLKKINHTNEDDLKSNFRILIPINMLRSGEETLLDDITVSDIEERLNTPVVVVGSSGEELLESLLDD